jgi:hypothetical protein
MSHPGERCHASAENFKKVRVDRVKMSDQRNLELDLGKHQTSSCLDLLPYSKGRGLLFIAMARESSYLKLTNW